MTRKLSTTALISLLTVFSGCAIKRPDIDLCIINAPAKYRRCYNYLRDYDDNGQLLATAKPTIRMNPTVDYLNKYFTIDSDQGPVEALARFKAYLQTLREEYKNNN